MKKTEPIIEVSNLSKKYSIRDVNNYASFRDSIAEFLKKPFKKNPKKDYWALKDINFKVRKGEVIGIIGPNGAGKSTLLKILTRITPPTKGEIILRGRVASLLEVGTGFHQELTGRENIFLNGAILGMSKKEILMNFDKIVEFSGVGKFLDTPVKHFSSGMQVRLAFSIAAHLNSDILLVDEVLAVGDAEFQKKSIGKMKDVTTKEGRTVLFVSHNMETILGLCQRVIIIKDGSILSDSDPKSAVEKYLKSGVGISTKKEWVQKDAPGDDIAKIKSIRIINQPKTSGQIDIKSALSIEIDYWIYKTDLPLGVNLQFINDQGLNLFSSSSKVSAKKIGRQKEVCTVPPNIFNAGLLRVNVGIVSLTPLSQTHAAVSDAISLHMVDKNKKWNENYQGLIKPDLKWQT